MDAGIDYIFRHWGKRVVLWGICGEEGGIMAALLIPPSSCCSSPKFLLCSRGSSSTSPLLVLLRSLCFSSHRNTSSKLTYRVALRAYQHPFRALQNQVPINVFRTSVIRRCVLSTVIRPLVFIWNLFVTPFVGQTPLQPLIVDIVYNLWNPHVIFLHTVPKCTLN